MSDDDEDDFSVPTSFSDFQELVVGIVATWTLGLIVGMAAWVFGLGLDVIDALAQIPIYVIDAFELVFVDVIDVGIDLLLSIESIYLDVVGGAGPFAWILAALFLALVLFAGAITLRSAIRVIPIL